MPEVIIIILNYSSLEYTIQCVESIYNECGASRNDFEIIVLDNGSDRFDRSELSRRFPEIKIIESKINLGFGKANNRAAREVDCKYLLFLNNDTKVLNNFVTILKDFMEVNPDVAICGAQQFNQKMEPVRSFNYFPRLFHRVYRIGLLKRFYESADLRNNINNLTLPTEVEVLSGADLFVRYSFFKSIGGFDENIFLYHEEEDLAMQARKMNMKLFLIPQAKIQHFLGKSSPLKIAVFMEDTISLIYFYKKYMGLIQVKVLYLLFILKYFQRWIKYSIKKLFARNNRGFAEIYFKLFRWAFIGFPTDEVVKLRRNYKISPDIKNTPIIIIARDRLTCLKKLIAWLETAGYNNIII